MKCGDTWHRLGFTCTASRYQCRKCKKFGHFTKSCLSTMASVNELNLDLTGEAAHQQKINALTASKETFCICNVKATKAKNGIYTNLKINGTNNYLHTRVDTALDINLLPATIYTQIYEDSNLEHLGPMDISLSMYNDSAIQTFGTCIIPLASPIDGCIHETVLCGKPQWLCFIELWGLTIPGTHPATPCAFQTCATQCTHNFKWAWHSLHQPFHQREAYLTLMCNTL